MGRMEKLQRLAGQANAAASVLPLVEITDDRRVLIEHHQGVVAYSPGEICIRVRFGLVRIWGANLFLAKMNTEQVVICGCIAGIELLKKGRNRK